MRNAGATRKLLILDLDETLFFATAQPLARIADFQVDKYHVYLRPNWQEFLAFCLAHFDLAIWTAATADYAQAMLARLFVDPSQLAFVWSRKRCTYCFDREKGQEYWRKDLKKLRRQGIDLRQVLAVDDIPRNYERSYGNVIAVREFNGEIEDDELFWLMRYLPTLLAVPNVRAIEKRSWRTKQAKVIS